MRDSLGTIRQKVKSRSGRIISYRQMISTSRLRLTILILCCCSMFSVIAVRLCHLSLFGDQVLLSEVQYGIPKVSMQRAEIVDTNGVVLATNLETESLYANPKIMIDRKESAQLLAKNFKDLDEKKLLKDFNSEKSFVWVKRNLTPKDQQLIYQLGIPGLAFETEEKRVYPQSELLSHVLGYVGIDGNGLAGVERYFNEQLRDKPEEPLRLTVDVRVQNALRDEMMFAMKKFSAKAATGVIMDVNNGEVIAMSSLPDFDPHQPGRAAAGATFNRTTLGVYEMGSTFKTFTMAMGLESEKIGLGSVYDVKYPIRIGKFKIRDFHPKAPVLSVPEIFMYSSNIGTAHIAEDIGTELQKTYLTELGLLDALEIEVPEKTSPLYPSSWGRVHTLTISYGHGIAVSPVHLVQAIAPLVNGGMFFPASLQQQSSEARRVFSKETSDNMRKLLRLVVAHGTGRKSNVKGYFVGGKTGTAEKPSKGVYNRKAMLSSFVGVFPMHKPQYVVLVVLDEPQGIAETGGYATGGATAAPTVGNVIKRIIPILNIGPEPDEYHLIEKELYVDYKNKGQDLAAL